MPSYGKCGHIYCSMNFCSQNPVISLGILMIGNFAKGIQLAMYICCKMVWFESEFCVSCASYITTLSTINIFKLANL